jgi:uncharacterized protein (DUF1015 family)
VPRFDPFPGLRYDFTRHDPAVVTAPPYDVIDDDGRAALARRSEHNVVHLDLPVDDDGGDPYQHAATLLAAWEADGTLVRDTPSFYVYRMTHVADDGTACATTGVFGALEISAPEDGQILPHEHTTPKAKTDRLDLTRATNANLSAVWGLSPAPGLSALLHTDAEPLAAWSDDHDVDHALWQLNDPARVTAIAELVATRPIVIADGHHRFAIALAHRDECPGRHGPASVLTYVVELATEALTVGPIHRLISGLPDGFDLVEALSPWFVATPAGTADPGIAESMARQRCMVLVLPERVWLLTPRPTSFVGLRDLDTVRLDAALAALPDHQLTFQHGIDNVTRRVGAGEAQAGVLLRPATVAQIIEIAEGGERMPPKTTFFSPKPATGAVFRTLD